MDFYQGCSYDAPGVKLGPAPGVTSLKHRNKERKLWNSSSLKQEGVELWSFGLEIWYLELYQFYSYDTPGVKTGPIRGVISWNNSNREGRINFVGKLTQVSDPGPSWPSCFLNACKYWPDFWHGSRSTCFTDRVWVSLPSIVFWRNFGPWT